MTTTIHDRRDEPSRHRFGKDRARFLNRIRASLKKAINEKVASGSITDFEKGGVKVPIPKKITDTPVLHHGQGPYIKRVFPGNLYTTGDVVPVPAGGGGGKGNEGDPDAEDDEDDFVWVNEDEFLDIFFEGRQLPDMVKLHNEGNSITHLQRSGHTVKGPTHKMDMRVTNAKRKKDALVLKKGSERRLLKNLSEQYDIYRKYDESLPELDLKEKTKSERIDALSAAVLSLQEKYGDIPEIEQDNFADPILSNMFNCVSLASDNASDISDPEDKKRLQILEDRIPEQMKTGLKADKFQDSHLTFHFDKEQPKPATKAVMFCKMDVSASMTQDCKNNAKAFFWLLHKFLRTNYEEVDLVFITHTTTAEEVDEEEFFYGKRSGGTLVSSCLEKEIEIMDERYDSGEWNIYSVQASDGDNVRMDNQVVDDLMRKILPRQQASYFIETRDPQWAQWQGDGISELHELYISIAKEFPNLKTAFVKTPGEAMEAFTDFFPTSGQSQKQQPSMG